MPRRWPLYSLVLGVSVLSVLSLSGCDFLAELFRLKGDANAQQTTQLVDRPVQTVSIRAGSFSIESDTAINFATDVIVKDQVIIYQTITGRAFFTLENNTNVSTVTLNSNSVIIERPADSLLTLINIDLNI
jgi:hypothetical protein